VSTRTVNWFGAAAPLVGSGVSVGAKAPDFTVTDAGWKPRTLADSGKGVRVFASVPSIDTGVCDLETRRFDAEVEKLPGVSVFVVSNDMPPALKRYCGAANVTRVTCWSDFNRATGERSFGDAFGCRIRDAGLLARAVWVVGPDDVVRHHELVDNTGSPPDFDALLGAVKKLI